MQTYYPLGDIKGLWRFRQMLHSLRSFAKSDVAQVRLKIIRFYETYGEKATLEAYGATRKVISRWRLRMEDSEGSLWALVPGSTAPRRRRKAAYPAILVEHIRTLRWQHPRLGKEKLKPFTDEFCRKNRIAPVSISTIGNIIKRNDLFYQKAGKVYHDPSSRRGQRPHGKKRLRVRHLKLPKRPGHIFSDTVERTIGGKKRYYYNALDGRLKIALSLDYPRISSRNMTDFYRKFRDFYPAKIRSWQTDNGPENLGEFDRLLKKERIPHRFIYPGCPKTNGYAERFNRTFQEEFLNNNLDVVHEPKLFRPALHDWLMFYNTKRVHKALNNVTPMDNYLRKHGMSHMYLTHTPTSTPLPFVLWLAHSW